MAAVVSAQYTDYRSVTGLAAVPLAQLLKEAAELEAAQNGHFTTALADAERRYLDIMAELYRRGQFPGKGGCGPGQGGRCSCVHETHAPPLSEAARVPLHKRLRLETLL